MTTPPLDPRGGASVRRPDLVSAEELARGLGISPTLAHLLLLRGVEDEASGRRYLEPSLAHLSPPEDMCDRDAAADRIVRAIRERERIVVFGDYDVDGTTSAAILADVIEMLGGDVTAMLASRFAGGYGLSAEALERCLSRSPTLLVTCDCGSSDHERIAVAQSRGVDVVVIDHHLVPSEALPALAFLNPHRPECPFPFKGMASAGLAFSVAAAIRKRLDPNLDMRPFLDLVALGTVADVAPLHGDNRALVRAGLARISAGQMRPGIAALLEIAGGRSRGVGARDIAFKLAPRINAAGRLGDPTISLELLRARDAIDARARASLLEQKNQDRRAIQDRVTAEAIEQALAYAGSAPNAPVLAASTSFHRGVAGISAAKLMERFRVPAFVVAIEDGVGHGSARTIAGVDVHAILEKVSPLLRGFGGHAAAAGFLVDESKLPELREALSAVIISESSERKERGPIDLDVDSPFALPLASELARLEPVGEANQAPRVRVDAKIPSVRAVGDARHHKLELEVAGKRLSAFAPSGIDVEAARSGRAIVVGLLRPDGWRGGESVEIEVESVDHV